MHEDDRTGAGVFDDAIANDIGSGSFPIQRIDIPQRDFVTKLLIDPFLLPRRDRAIRRAEQSRRNAGGVSDGVVGSAKLAPNTFIRHLSKIGMRPTVVGDFVSFSHLARYNLRMLGYIFAD